MQEDYRDLILEKALQLVPTKGWSNSILMKSAQEIGLHSQVAKVMFPRGIIEIIDYYLQSIDKTMLTEIKKLPLSEMRIRDRIKQALLIRIKILINRKKITLKTISFLSLPWHITHAMKFSWRVADLIWKEAGLDSSTDFNYYTKRVLLMKVYESAIMYCLNDKSNDLHDTIDFLERKIENVITVGKFFSKFKKDEKKH